MNTKTSRRDWLRNTLCASVAGSVMSMAPSRVLAACTSVPMPRTLVNLMMYGGMDTRFIFMPAPNHPDANYLSKIWAARAALYPAGYPDYTTMFDNEYLTVSDPASGLPFGIHASCDWLKNAFESGQVAVIANSFCSRNRRHDQSQLNANVGEPGFTQLLYGRDGWGGRLAAACGPNANTVELSNEPSVFGHGVDSADRMSQIVHAKDTRNIALPNVRADLNATHRSNILARSMQSYYAARGREVGGSGTPYDLFFNHYDAFTALGEAVESRLSACGPLPMALQHLHLNDHHFPQQCRNLYDVCQAPDLFGVRLMSMRYNHWDTHHNEHSRITSNLSDVFGAQGGLATTLTEINNLPGGSDHPSGNVTVYVASDFGRQLAANGSGGTDHGRGLYSLLIGEQVNGGVYGEMFPERESVADANGVVPMEKSGADIEGLTSTERVLSEVCEWMQPGSSTSVFPDATQSAIETPGMLDGLMQI